MSQDNFIKVDKVNADNWQKLWNEYSETPDFKSTHRQNYASGYLKWLHRNYIAPSVKINSEKRIVNNNEPIITLTIKSVKFVGKWVEFWFEEDFPLEVPSVDYQLSSKSGYLIEAIEKADIYDEVMSKGLTGRKITWEKIGVNYEIKSIQ